MKKTTILLIMIALSLQGMVACKTNDVQPDTSTEVVSQSKVFVDRFKLQKVDKPTNLLSIIYLKDIQKASKFFLSLTKTVKVPVQANNQTLSPASGQGKFTFLNGNQANIVFDDSGNIFTLNTNGDNTVSYNYDTANSYVEITKWGIIALQDDFKSGGYQYYHAPIIRWCAYLLNGWSSIQFMDSFEQANFEGEGTFEFYPSNDNSSVTDPNPFKPEEPSQVNH